MNLRPLGYEDREAPFNPVPHSLNVSGTHSMTARSVPSSVSVSAVPPSAISVRASASLSQPDPRR